MRMDSSMKNLILPTNIYNNTLPKNQLQESHSYTDSLFHFEGTTLTENLLKHAKPEKIPSTRHPNPKYPYRRIFLDIFDPQINEMINRLDPQHINDEIINSITPDMIQCNCPHRDKFVKIFDVNTHTENEAMVWTACKHTTYAAARRQIKSAPIPEPSVADDFLQHSIKIIEKEIGDYLHQFTYSVKDWYAHLNLKKQRAINPIIDYYNKPDFVDLTPKQYKNFMNMHYTGILKEELQPTDGKPRLVCSIPQRIKYIMGPITWQLEEIFQDHLQGYCGGKNLTQMSDFINKYLDEGFTKVVEGDGSAFDNTQDVSLKAVDRYVYSLIEESIYHVPKEDFHKVSQALYKTMDIEYIDPQTKKKKKMMSYRILGTVFSGDCDTTLMNTTRMALYNRYVNDKAGLVYGKDYVCFAKGDDFTVLYKPYVSNDFIEKAYYKYFLKASDSPDVVDTRVYGLGQILKFITFGDAKTLSFCSLKAFFTDSSEQHIFLTRDPNKFFTLSKYSRKMKTYTNTAAYQYYVDLAVALRASYAKIRFFEQIAQYCEEKARYIKEHHKINIKEYFQRINTLSQRAIKDQKHYIEPQILQLANLELKNIELVGHRHEQHKIQDNYWETMQQIERIHTKVLDAKTADYISLQLETEYMTEYIKSMYHEGPK